MKKLIVLVTMVLALAFATTALAANNGAILSAQEKTTEKMVSALTTSEGTLASFSTALTPEFKKNLTDENYGKLKKDMADKLGSMKTYRLIEVAKFDNIDRLVYRAEFSKEKVVNLVFFFNKEEKPLLVNFQALIVPPAPAKEAGK